MDDRVLNGSVESGASDGKSTRRDFVKSGVAVTSGLMLSGIYAKPSMQSIELAVVPNPSVTNWGSYGSFGSFGSFGSPSND